MTPQELARLLEVMEKDIVPLTHKGVEAGNKVFGAAILRMADLSLVVAGTNEEVECPLWHGEMVAIRDYSALSVDQRPRPEQCLLLATHEPCPMCLAASAWAGLPHIYYLFAYEQTRDSFDIPHDLRILSEIFGCEEGRYAENNAYWQSHSIPTCIQRCSPSDRTTLQETVERLSETYAELSSIYQAGKSESTIPRK